MAEIGRSTDPSTVTRVVTVAGSEPASLRYCNPGAQYPSARAALFGQLGYGIIGGGHKIATFPTLINGAAANFDLLNRKYVGMTMGAAGKQWTGSYGFGIPGYSDEMVLTREMLDDDKLAIAIMKAIAGRESGRKNNLNDDEWQQAHAMFKAGSADAYLDQQQGGGVVTAKPGPAGPSGVGLVRRAQVHIGEEYRNVLVPKDDPNWKGPWDCAEFMSWLVYQEAGKLYGCVDNNGKPAQVEAYTGAWRDDVERLGIRVSVDKAAATVGGILLRYPPSPGAMGHIALCDGNGGTIEAKGKQFGVVADSVHGRRWDTGVLIPGISYDDDDDIAVREPALIYRRNAPNMDPAVIAAIQRALADRGFFAGTADGRFETETEAGVIAFQRREGLVVDGEVGPNTAAALGTSLVSASGGATAEAGAQPVVGGAGGVGTLFDPLKAGDLFKSFDPKFFASLGLGVASMNPFVMLAAQVLPGIIQAVVGDKAGTVAETVARTVKDITQTETPDAAADKLKATPAAVVALQIELAKIAAAQEDARQKAQFAVLQAQLAADADRRKAEIAAMQIDQANTSDARAALRAMAGQDRRIAWTAPALSGFVTIGFFIVLVTLLSGAKVADDSTLQVVNIVIGALTAAFATVINFWLGSSQGSRLKDVAAITREETQAARVDQAVRAEHLPTTATPKSVTRPKPKDQLSRCLDIVLSKESAADQGAQTRYGLTRDEVADTLRKKDLTADDFQKLSRDQGCEIYRVRYWNVLRCDELPVGVDLVVFDTAAEIDVIEAAKMLQKVLGVSDDGAVGPVTLGAVGLMTPRAIVTRLSDLRRERLRLTKAGVAADSNRIEDIDRFAREMIDQAADG